MTQQTTGFKKPKPTAKEKYHQLEDKKIRIEAETLTLYQRIDALRRKSGQLEAEIRDAYKAMVQERKN
jgi:hypothetical protein